jgi:hypothetical protein
MGRLAVLLVPVVLLPGCAGFGRDADGCWTSQCREWNRINEANQAAQARSRAIAKRAAQQRRAEQERHIADCRAMVVDPQAAPTQRDQCFDLLDAERKQRWASSDITCHDDPIGTGRVAVTCDLPVHSDGQADFFTATEKAYQLVAFAALSSGKAFAIRVGNSQLEGHSATTTTPVSCKPRNHALYVLAAGLHGLASGNNVDRTHCTSDRLGGVGCETQVARPPEPLPPEPMVCEGGDTITSMTSVTTRDVFDILSAKEAPLRDNVNLPNSRRPWPAEPIAKLYRDLH